MSIKSFISIEVETINYRNPATNDHYIFEMIDRYYEDHNMVESFIKVYYYLPKNLDNYIQVEYTNENPEENILNSLFNDETLQNKKEYTEMPNDIFMEFLQSLNESMEEEKCVIKGCTNCNKKITFEAKDTGPIEEKNARKNNMLNEIYKHIHSRDLISTLDQNTQDKIQILCDVQGDMFFILEQEQKK